MIVFLEDRHRGNSLLKGLMSHKTCKHSFTPFPFQQPHHCSWTLRRVSLSLWVSKWGSGKGRGGKEEREEGRRKEEKARKGGLDVHADITKQLVLTCFVMEVPNLQGPIMATCHLGKKKYYGRRWSKMYITEYYSYYKYNLVYYSIPQYITVYHSISQYITIYHSIPQYITVYHSIPQYITVYHSISQYITVYYSVLQLSYVPLWGCLLETWQPSLC